MCFRQKNPPEPSDRDPPTGLSWLHWTRCHAGSPPGQGAPVAIHPISIGGSMCFRDHVGLLAALKLSRVGSTVFIVGKDGNAVLGRRRFLPQAPRSYPIPMAHRVTPGKPEVTPGTKSYWHTGTTPSLVWQTK